MAGEFDVLVLMRRLDRVEVDNSVLRASVAELNAIVAALLHRAELDGARLARLESESPARIGVRKARVA